MRFPQDEGSHPAVPHRVVVRHRLARAAQRRAPARLPDHVLSRAARDRRAQSERIRAAPDHHRARGAERRRAAGGSLHDQKVARAAFGLAGAAEGRTHVWIDDWSLAQEGGVVSQRASRRAISRCDFGFHADAAAAPPGRGRLQPQRAASRNRRATTTASRICAWPARSSKAAARSPVTGTRMARPRMVVELHGRARVRAGTGSGSTSTTAARSWLSGCATRAAATFWAGGAHRSSERRAPRVLAPTKSSSRRCDTWRSPRTGATLPGRVAREGRRDRGHDRAAHGRPGARHARFGRNGVLGRRGDARCIDGKLAGRGYLELTGYWQPMKLLRSLRPARQRPAAGSFSNTILPLPRVDLDRRPSARTGLRGSPWRAGSRSATGSRA